MHRNARSERSLNHRKANYDPDQFTDENSKNPSLNSTLGCLKVVDTFRDANIISLTLITPPRSAPAHAPTAAEHHKVAAVLRPQTFPPSFMKTPAPRIPLRKP